MKFLCALLSIAVLVCADASNAGDLKSGTAAFSRGDYVAADANLRKLAEQGNPIAQIDLGAMYLNGRGVMKDDVLAAAWFRKAAEQGNVAGESNLGTMYLHGVGVPKDFVQAMLWFRKAADQGDTVAEADLGDMYVYGQGVQPDFAQASMWYRKAAERGDAISQENLGSMYFHGQGVPQDFVQSAFWLGKSAAQGNEQAEYTLGLLYTTGKGVPKDYVQANILIRKAVASGNNQALASLAYLYANGLGVPQNLVFAYALSTIAIDPVRAGASSTLTESNLRDEVASKMTVSQKDAAEKLIVEMLRNGVLESLQQSEGDHQRQIKVTLMIPDSTAQDAALLATQGIAHRRLVAASEFFGRYLLNTRARAEFCKDQGSDVSHFVQAVMKDDAQDFREASAIFAQSSQSVEVVYKGIRRSALDAVAHEMHLVAADDNISMKDVCTIYDRNAAFFAQGWSNAARRPIVHKILVSH